MPLCSHASVLFTEKCVEHLLTTSSHTLKADYLDTFVVTFGAR